MIGPFHEQRWDRPTNKRKEGQAACRANTDEISIDKPISARQDEQKHFDCRQHALKTSIRSGGPTSIPGSVKRGSAPTLLPNGQMDDKPEKRLALLWISDTLPAFHRDFPRTRDSSALCLAWPDRASPAAPTELHCQHSPAYLFSRPDEARRHIVA
jgi:hypothetical protein